MFDNPTRGYKPICEKFLTLPAACEGFFAWLKNELFYGQSWVGVSLETFQLELNCYINWYNQKRIKLSLGGLSPMEYRRHLGFAA